MVISLPGWAAAPAQAACSGCLCPGNPCKLCPLPPLKDSPDAAQEVGACVRIRESVTPVSKETEPDAHYASLNNAMRECVKNGGDVFMNSRRNPEFPYKHYCKPYLPLKP
ncbi:hypothetical protein [Nitrosovibrio sp. Nv17]|uniref:hypothetical protein n=1 Tax=Nitrosovibrio sp. Nv17 TaxID=1855339 RepID=UPI002100A697|nr:hypothetical protein [Nitrosovibrio sp. Nv17]